MSAPDPGHEGLILVIDDDLDIREALSEALEDRGFAVVSAANGLEGLDLLRSMEVPPSVILLDLMMPVLDGYGFLEEQRKDPAIAPIPVAVFTAGRGVDRDRLGHAAAVISKPVRVAELVRTLEQVRAKGGTTP